jgi:hypothetical protein
MRVRSALLAVVVAVLAVSPTAASARHRQAPAVELISITQPWLHEDETFQIKVRLAGVPADAVLRLERHSAVTTRSAFEESVNEELGNPDHVKPFRLADLQPANGLVDLAYPLAEDEELENFGVYPMRLLAEGADGTQLAELVTYLVLLPSATDAEPLSVAVLMEIGAPPILQPDGSYDLKRDARAAITSRINVLRRTRQPVTVAPLPETIDGLAEMDDADATLNELNSVLGGRTPLARPYVDLDLDALVSAGMFTEEPPEAHEGAQVIRNQLHKNPTPDIWLSGATLGNGAIDALRQMRASYVLLPESAVAAVPDLDEDDEALTTTPVALSENGPTAFVADEALSSRLIAGDGALGTQRFLAELALVWMSDLDRERGIVVRIPQDAQLDEDLLTGALENLGPNEVVAPHSLRDMFQALVPADEELPIAELSPHTDMSDLSALAEPRVRAGQSISGLAATLDDTDLIDSLNRSLLVSLGAEVPDGQRMAYVNRVFAEVAELAGDISAPEKFQITLTARDGNIPLTLTNESDRNVTVRVHVESSQLSFPEGKTFTQTLTPGNTRLDVAVRTRTSGAFPLEITVTSPDGSFELDETTFTIRSTAVSGAGIVLSVGAGLFLLIWWARHWRTAKRSRRLVGSKGPMSPVDR